MSILGGLASYGSDDDEEEDNDEENEELEQGRIASAEGSVSCAPSSEDASAPSNGNSAVETDAVNNIGGAGEQQPLAPGWQVMAPTFAICFSLTKSTGVHGRRAQRDVLLEHRYR